ncbi:MAG: hypothetical protein DIU72_007810 [Pseudomonadota bacterium]
MESRLDRGLRAIAWTAVVATVLALLATGAWIFRPEPAGANLVRQEISWESSFEEEAR